MLGAAGNVELSTQATSRKTVLNTARHSVVSRCKNPVIVAHKDGTDVAAQARGARGRNVGNLHEVLVPTGTLVARHNALCLVDGSELGLDGLVEVLGKRRAQRRDVGMSLLGHLASKVELHDLGNATRMAAALELCDKEDLEDALVLLKGDEAAGQGDDVAVVVTTEQLGELGARDAGSADAGHLVGRNRHADASAAHKHALVSLACGDGLAYRQTVDYILSCRDTIFGTAISKTSTTFIQTKKLKLANK